jgi:hypothetical protein
MVTAHVHPNYAPQTLSRHEPSGSALLKLPAELRNRICQYALTADDGVYLDARSTPRFLQVDTSDDPKDGRESNVLKLTCRQLYRETAGLEIKFNTVEFCGTTTSSGPAHVLNDFLSTCTALKIQWLKNVRLYFPSRGIAQVDTFCRNTRRALARRRVLSQPSPDQCSLHSRILRQELGWCALFSHDWCLLEPCVPRCRSAAVDAQLPMLLHSSPRLGI